MSAMLEARIERADRTNEASLIVREGAIGGKLLQMMLQEARKSSPSRINLSREHVDISDSFPIHVEIFFSTLLRMYYIAEEMLSKVNTP